MMTCADPTCLDGIDVSTPDHRFCQECGGHSENREDVPPRGTMTIVDTAALLTIAATQITFLTMRVVDIIRARHPEPERIVRDKHPTVYVPLACGVATQFAGMTDACARRHGHSGRCMGDAEIEHMAEYGSTSVSVVEPAVDRPGLLTDIAALSRHVEACPASLLDSDQPASVAVWVEGVRTRVESLVAGETFSDDTRA